MDMFGPEDFPDFLNGKTYQQVVECLSRHLPDDLKYTAWIAAQSKTSEEFRLIFEGERNTLKDVWFDQKIDRTQNISKTMI